MVDHHRWQEVILDIWMFYSGSTADEGSRFYVGRGRCTFVGQEPLNACLKCDNSFQLGNPSGLGCLILVSLNVSSRIRTRII